MTEVTVSSKFQIVIPKAIRGKAGIREGEKLAVLFKDGLIALIPERPLKSLHGMFKGIDVRGIREKKDRP